MEENLKLNVEEVELEEEMASEKDVEEIITEFEKKTSDLVNSKSTRLSDGTAMYLRDIAATASLSKDDQINIAKKLKATAAGSPEYLNLRDILINANLKLVASIAFKNAGKGIDLPDLISEGSLGLIKAIDNFDPDKGVALTTYAYSWIKLSIDVAIQKYGNVITIPMWIKIKLSQLARAEYKLAQTTGKLAEQLRPEELAAELKMDPSEVLDLITIRDRNNMRTIDDDSSEDENKFEIPDRNFKSPIEEMIEDENHRAMLAIIDKLPKEKYREIIKMRFGFTTGYEMSCAEIGRYYESLGYKRGITREAIRQIEEKALKILRTPEYVAMIKEAGLA